MRPRADTLLIWTGGSCSYGCAACPIDQAGAPAGMRADYLQQALAALPEHRGRLAILVGGEPFLRPDFLRLAATIRAAGCAPGLVTTGRPLLYPKLRDSLRRAAFTYIRIQLFGVGAEHDRATATPGGFEQTVAGLRAWLSEAGPDCDVDVALSTRGRPLDAVVDELEVLARALPAAPLQLVVALDPAAPPDGDAVRQTVARLAAWNDDAARPLLVWEGLPAGAAGPRDVAIAPPRAAFVGLAPPAYCLGAVAALARAAPRPDTATRANSFNYVRTGTSVAWNADAASCGAHAAAAGADPSRNLWLVDGDRLLLHSTDTGDFGAAEIARIKGEWSHLFVDRAAPGVLDDFTEGMRRVLPDPTCAGCAHRAVCGRRYVLVDGPPFAREEARILDYLRGLRGRVLDVGCGEQLYREVIAARVRGGAIEYHGLDPDEPSLARWRRALPEGRYSLGGIEDFRAAPASFDRLLCLRALNHVFDLDEALARMAALLTPRGELLLVETTPFAMLRRPEQVAAADRAPRAGHQHFRNVTSEEVVPLARRRGLRVVHHHEVGLANTNQWILLLARA